MMHNKQRGFTVIELVTVIILLGILGSYVIPKFNGSRSFEPYTYRAQLIAALRLTQQRAMQQRAILPQTNRTLCHQIVFDNEQARYGIPDRVDCDEQDFPDDWLPDHTGLVVDDNHQITFQITSAQDNSIVIPSLIEFNGLGQPISNGCNTGCTIQIRGADETVEIKIESEGYIHAI